MKLSFQFLLPFLWISLSSQELLYKWRYIDFDWYCETHKNEYIKKGLYIKNASVPIDTLITNGRIFITIPRSKGVPASLGTLNTQKQNGGGPLVRPYPSWGWASDIQDCYNTIISVYRVDLDDCGRLWVLDNGKIGEEQKCPPKILAFDLKTDRLMVRKEIPNKYAFNSNGNGNLVTPLVKTSGKQCEKITMYMADVEGYGLVIWRGGNNFQRFDSPDFAADKTLSNFTLNNDTFYLADGLIGLALYEDENKKNSKLYCSSLASYNMYHISVNSLEQSTDGKINIQQDKGDVDFRKVPLAIKGNTIFFSSLEDNAIRMWDINTEFTKKNVKIIKKDNNLLQFVSGLKILKNSNNTSKCTTIYGLSNKYQKVATGTLSLNKINYQIFKYELN
ncbi:major royal jelly protein 3-like [Vespa mandarinia]|uniref:major royal jelly protein 3-like n=1 Tax=Vespa mandarinia TaxID=7446 RepID=UPI001608F8CA|nr:major royal jelly protein 3-like [Vespa mandarinia]